MPWARRASDAERLDPANGLLLSALWDAAFDRGLVTFEDDGTPRLALVLGSAERATLTWIEPMPVGPVGRARPAWHRECVFEA